jgi:hypothetical protein
MHQAIGSANRWRGSLHEDVGLTRQDVRDKSSVDFFVKNASRAIFHDTMDLEDRAFQCTLQNEVLPPNPRPAIWEHKSVVQLERDRVWIEEDEIRGYRDL